MQRLKFTEHTERPILIDYLKQVFGSSYRVFQEVRNKENLQIDIVILDTRLVKIEKDTPEVVLLNNDAVKAIIETKRPQVTKAIEDHEPQLRKYCESANSRFGFITDNRTVVSFQYNNDYTDFQKDINRLDTPKEIAEYIFVTVTNRKKRKKGATELIRELERSVENLLYFTQKIAGEDWGQKLNLEDKSKIDDEIENLQQTEQRYKFYQRTAAYIALAQLLFYMVYRQHWYESSSNTRRKDIILKTLSSTMGKPDLIQRTIQSIPEQDLNFTTILGPEKQIFPELDDDASQVLFEIIQHLEGISKEEVIENDIIGQIFQRLLPFKVRKELAAFYTTNKAAELLCELSIEDSSTQIYDPACGSGTLLIKAYQRKRNLGLRRHAKLLEDISGSDISGVAAIMTTVNLAIQDPNNWIDQVKIYPHDFFHLIGGITVAYEKVKITSNSDDTVSGKSIFDHLTKETDLIIGNPPFTRGENLEESYRRYLTKHILFRDLKLDLSRVGLYAYFLVASAKILRKPRARIAFILPLTAIGSSMQPAWNVVFKHNFGIKVIVIASDSDEAFSDSRLHEIMVIIEKGYTGKCKRIKLIGEIESQNIEYLAQAINDIQYDRGMGSEFIYQHVSQKWLKDRSCGEWGIVNYSIFLEGFYDKLIPLDIKEYKKSHTDGRDDKEDLSSFVKVISACKYTPINFWLLPNKFWEVIEVTENELKIQATSLNTLVYEKGSGKKVPAKLTLPLSIFSRALGNSIKQYEDCPPIIPSDHQFSYYLTKENIEDSSYQKHVDLKSYYLWGSLARAKDNEFNLLKETYIHSQVRQYSIGMLTRTNFNNSKTIFIRLDEPLMGSRMIDFGFYSNQEVINDIFFAYLTSSFFLVDVLVKAKRRSGLYFSLHKTDIYDYLFPNLHTLLKNKDVAQEIIECSNKYNRGIVIKDRPVYRDLIEMARLNEDHPLRLLDEAWARALDTSITLDTLYSEIAILLNG